MQVELGMSVPMVITARHLANLAPSFTYSGAALGQTVEAFGDFFARAQREILGAGIDLDAGQDAVFGQQFHERRAVGRLLAQRFIVKNHAADVTADSPLRR